MKKTLLLFTLFISVLGVAAFAEVYYTLDGTRVSYDYDMASGDTMLFIWTSRCPYCIKELRDMNKSENICKYSKCYFVNIGESDSTVKKVVNSLKLNDSIASRIIVDKSASLADKFSVVGVPTFILMRDGKILGRAYHFDEGTIRKKFQK